MNYLSVCSGIEAATEAWHPFGWAPWAYSEIDAHPSAVLNHHYGSNFPGEAWSHNAPPNLGDMQGFKDWPDATVDLLVGGTPCQSFSVAGLRKGLADPRGNLMLTYLAIAERYRPEWLVWENVPGALSVDGGRAFGALIRGLAELGYHAAWRVLDAQYVRVDGFGRAVPQRRRRVFVVGHLGDWRRAAAVLFERESLSWDSAPRRQAGEGLAADVVPGLVSSGRGVERAGETRGQDPVVAYALNAKGGMGRIDGESETLVAHALRAEGFDASEDGTGRGTPLVPIAFSAKRLRRDAEIDLSPTLRAGGFTESHANAGVMPAIAFAQNQAGDVLCSDVMHSLQTNSNATGRHSPTVFSRWAVRRLLPIECEKLQAFRPNYTLVPFRGKPMADGHRYKMLGNSMAVNVMRWIGHRIRHVQRLTTDMGKT